MGLTIKKSIHYDRDKDFNAMNAQVQKNTWKANEILKQTSNAIAPIDTGRLRQNVTNRKSPGKTSTSAYVEWRQPYSGTVYMTNYKNPQTKHWVEQGYNKKQAVLLKVMQEKVVL